MLLKVGPEKWIIQETKEIAEMNFRFLDKTNAASYATRLANNMQIVSPEHTVRHLSLHFKMIRVSKIVCHMPCLSP